jgi:penicillin-binding protein 1C
VRSTLDGALQQVAAETLRRHLLAVRGQRVQDGALLVADNASGEVLAYVGGSGDLSSARFVDGVQARRQAGSALKPFLYALAMEQRLLTPASLLEDTPLEIPVAGGLYRPQNYDEQFHGLVSARTALASSLNIPAVRTLELVGPETFVQQLRRLDFAGLRESGDYYGPALALGSADVSLWELVNAYRTLANGGTWAPLRMAAEEGAGGGRRKVYSPEAAFLVSHVLADREARSATFGLENPLATRFWTAVKTGTSKEMRDNWCVGFSRRYTVGVWVGNFSGEPMRDVSGITGAAPVWLDVMRWLHGAAAGAAPEPPPGVQLHTVAFPQAAEPERVEWFLTGTEPGGRSRPAAAGLARILAPAAGTIVALDPDIPPARQRVAFEAQDAGPRFRWVLDGNDAGAAAAPVFWKPVPGRHTLALVGEDGRPATTVTFTVRGPAAAPADD